MHNSLFYNIDPTRVKRITIHRLGLLYIRENPYLAFATNTSPTTHQMYLYIVFFIYFSRMRPFRFFKFSPLALKTQNHEIEQSRK